MAAVNTLVYGRAMSERLTASDWLRHGLEVLAVEGPGGLKVAPLAETLKVSRGSFYWHFRDIADFKAQVLRAWQASETDQVIQDLEARAEPDRLKSLLRRAFLGRRTLERAMRAWAAEDPTVAAAVAAVDERRMAYIAGLLAAAGVEPAAARQRTSFLYWAYLGQTLVADRHAALPPAAMDAIADLFET